MKQVLVLGGNGLIGGGIAQMLVDKSFEVVVADKRKRQFNQKNIRWVHADILKPGVVERLIRNHQPEVIVNCVNIATICSHNTKKGLPKMVHFYVSLYRALDLLPHVHYIQVGTTGSGGLGLNIPFTHGEKIESLPIINKAAFAGVTTALLTLLSRSYDKDVKVSEVKPGLAVFADAIEESKWEGVPLVLINGGESGYYTYHEFALLTSFMGFSTVTEIVKKVSQTLNKEKSERSIQPYDIIANINHTIVAPDSDDEKQKQTFLERMAAASRGDAIVATGNLGPPAITRDLILSDLLLRHGAFTQEREFLMTFNEDTVTQQTLHYIRSLNKRLYKWLRKECTYPHLLHLLPYKPGHAEAWEIVHAKIQAATENK